MIPLLMLAAHFVGDFLLQTDWMALNKSKDNKALGLHVLTYSACFVFWGFPFVILTALFHFATDYVTSRITARLWAAEQRHWFFVVIGFDQLIHYTTLVLTTVLVGWYL